MTETAGHPPYILALDIGTSSVRAIAFDPMGQAKGSGCQVNYEMATTPDGGVEIDAETLLEVVSETLDRFCQVEAGSLSSIKGVAISTFWHNVIGVGTNGRAVTPLISWADTRPAAVMPELKASVNEAENHARTGCVLHPSYLPAKILWFARVHPEQFQKAERWMSFGEYLGLRMFNQTVCSISMASGTGLLNPHTCMWDENILAVLPIDETQLSPLTDLQAPLAGLNNPFAARWPALKDVPWWPAVGDGACSNIGSGCVSADRTALMVGTSGAMRVMWASEAFTIPDGLWCYRADGQRILMGGALSNGGNVYSWMKDTLQLEPLDHIEQALSSMEPATHGLTVLPFWAGERSPGWHASARATLTGLTLHTTPVDILRAGLESTAYCFASIYERLQAVNSDMEEIVASGAGLLQSPTWMQMMADVLGKPVTASAVAEASSRGAALLGLEAAGLLDDLTNAPVPLDTTFEPNMQHHQRYREAMEEQQELYDMMIRDQ